MSPSQPGPVYRALQSLPLPSLPFTVSHWVPGSSPFSTDAQVFVAIAVYLAIIFGGRELMRGSKPYRQSSVLFRFVEVEAKGRVERAETPMESRERVLDAF
jgi:hypothetical protein